MTTEIADPRERRDDARVRVAVLGCGKLAREVILPTLARIPDIEIAVVADADQAARNAAVALASSSASFAEWRYAVAEDVDAVVVALPTAMHAEAAIAVMEAGKSLYLEKPIAATLDEGSRVVETGNTGGLGWVGLKPRPHVQRNTDGNAGLEPRRHTSTVVNVGFNYRFNPLVVELRRRLRDGEIGAPRVIRTTFSTGAAPGTTWRRPDARGGGVLLDLGSHHIDLVRYLTGDEIVSVSAERTLGAHGAERVTVDMRLARGAVVQSLFATGAADDDRIEIEGERGALAIDRYRSWVVRKHGPAAALLTGSLRELGGWRYALEKQRAPWHEPSFARALHAFANAARGGPVEGATLMDGLRSLQAIDAVERSCVERRAIDVPAGHAGRG